MYSSGYNQGSYIGRRYDSITGVWTPSVYPDETRITAQATDLPITLAMMKTVLPVYESADDNYISLLIDAVTEQISRYIGQDVAQVTRQSIWYRPYKINYLPFGIHGNITSVVSRTEDGTDTALVEGTDYYIQGLDFKRIKLDDLALNGAFLVTTYQSGYTAGNIPAAMKAAIFQEVALQYKNRQDANLPARVSMGGLSIEARHLLMPFVRHVV